jgi:hypothetical protein
MAIATRNTVAPVGTISPASANPPASAVKRRIERVVLQEIKSAMK